MRNAVQNPKTNLDAVPSHNIQASELLSFKLQSNAMPAGKPIKSITFESIPDSWSKSQACIAISSKAGSIIINLTESGLSLIKDSANSIVLLASRNKTNTSKRGVTASLMISGSSGLIFIALQMASPP
ncbi:hypothetical protein P3339_23225 [Microbulbifer sp. MLAF003]|uniref:hypothetical protein n=1 Tax=Microbulbifer sp. MLAF003 TaxID=3032582 RepID=UPI0024AE42E4|nr:hypothetical protein [Microbulbifer sp. MLAF003]WHI51271.1 hypothetical protein P3339_23225 [Microbulbifer sp. MLAF003]